ncbi:MAG TPA: histidine kinase [Polyangia bacterium]|jgi:hypothetical protein|nr:histidine kinase [Polyangia bacterium]
MRRYWIPLFWLAFALVSTLQTWIVMITHGHSFARIAIFQCVVWSGWIALMPFVFRLSERFSLHPPTWRRVLLHVAAAGVVGVAHITWWIGAILVLRPYDKMNPKYFAPQLPEALVYRLPLEYILYAGALAVAHATALSRRAAELARSLGQARLHALELQLQPHFLFNTLNAVSALVRVKKNEEAVEVIAGLSELLRYTLDHQGQQLVPLAQEAAMLKRYLDIQRLRFADRLEIAVDVPAEARHAAVPTLLLQPLAENAIRHGIARSARPGRVEVRAFRREGTIEIEVFNTGSLGQTEGRGIGLRNTVERLRQLYGNAHRFELRQTSGGVLASISIPWSEVT